MTILINLLLAIWMIVALLMILVILMQRPKSEGLGAAFGGGVTENIFGAQTTTVLTTITGWLAGVFFVLTFALSVCYAHKATGESALSRQLKNTPVAAPAASPAVGASVVPNASPAPSLKPSDAAVGIVPPASVPVAPSATPAGSPAKQPKP